MKITKGIIPVGGFGTRWLPLTKAVEKHMLPVGRRPLVDYTVEDFVKAGVTDICFVVGEQSQQLKTYYGSNEPLERYLEDKSKTEQLEEIIDLRNKATFTFIKQPMGKYGTAIPIHIARDFIGGDSFVYSMGDDFIFHPDGTSEVKLMLEGMRASGYESGVMGIQIPIERVSDYGVIELDGDCARRVVEKPRTEDAPSNIATNGTYVFDNSLMPYVEAFVEQELGDREYYVNEGPLLQWLDAGNKIYVHRVQGEWLDGGMPDNWLAANNYIDTHSR